MEISLNNFSYYFGLTGNSGGLASMDMEFKPYVCKEQEIDDIKAAARAGGDLGIGNTYYHHWLALPEGIVADKNLITDEALIRRRAIRHTVRP